MVGDDLFVVMMSDYFQIGLKVEEIGEFMFVGFILVYMLFVGVLVGTNSVVFVYDDKMVWRVICNFVIGGLWFD